jgi:hypothetical protein
LGFDLLEGSGRFYKSPLHGQIFLEAPPPKRAGVLPYGSASRPGKDLGLFNIAPLDPVLEDRVYGEHAGQTV